MTFLNITYQNITIPKIEIIGMPSVLPIITYVLAIIGVIAIIKFIFEHIYAK
jgi:hypothetical protein